jgi:phage antirepressor YoqD-like protein
MAYPHKIARNLKKEVHKPPLSHEAEEELKSRFRPEVLLLDRYLSTKGLIKVDLSKLWGY